MDQAVREKSRMESVYDMVVLGGGPAGYTAALYGARAGLCTLVLEKLSPGGQMGLTDRIDNYPGFAEGIDGFTLGQKMKQQAEGFGVKTVYSEVFQVELKGKIKKVTTRDQCYCGKTVVIATGAHPRNLGLAGEKEWVNRGLSYCAACDGMFYKNKRVAVIGGGNSAGTEALHLSDLCEKVYLIHRRDTFSMSKICMDSIRQRSNIEILPNCRVEEFLHDDSITGVRLENIRTGKQQEVSVAGVFVSIGREPETELFAGQLERNEQGYIVADETTVTKLEGVFAAGDVRTKKLRQIVTAAADGAAAAYQAEIFLRNSGQGSHKKI